MTCTWETLKRKKKNRTNIDSGSFTQPRLLTVNYLWTIHKFSEIGATIDFLISNDFSSDNGSEKWYLKLFLKQKNIDLHGEYIGVFLNLRNTGNPVNNKIAAKFKVSLLNGKRNKEVCGIGYQRTASLFEAGRLGHGLSFFAEKNYIIRKKSNVLDKNGTLCLFCEIKFARELNSCLMQPFKKDIYVKSEFNVDNLLSEVKSWLNPQSETNFVIQCADNVQFHVHKILLVARSKVFAAMLRHPFREVKENKVIISDFDSNVINEMINYIYTDEIKNIDNVVSELLVAAEKYDIQRLKKMCELHILKFHMNIENAGYLLYLSDLCNCLKLKEKILRFVKENVADIVDNDSWKHYVDNRPQLYLETIKSLNNC